MIYIGIDIGKTNHVAGFISHNLLSKHKRFNVCPVLAFSSSRAGFEQLLEAIKGYSEPDQALVLVEKTGHYGFALEQFLLQHNVLLHKIHVQRRATKRKTDKRDALYLANTLYNQMALGVQDEKSEIRLVIPPSEAAVKLHPLIQRRAELTTGTTARKNQLIAICDELFPEITEVFADPNRAIALAIRESFPCPTDIAKASVEELQTCCAIRWPGQAALARLQDLAQTTIGTHNQARISALRLEQKQLITELRLLQAHLEAIELEIEKEIIHSREGAILISIPTIGPVQAAILLAHIGNIGNFERVSKLRGYCGWAPVESQTGTTLDTAKLDRGGNKLLKHTVYLIAWSCIRRDTEFKAVYERLVPLKCRWDERTKTWKGKNKVIGRIAGQIIGVIYMLLRRDYDLLASLSSDDAIPEPALYDREIHREHRMHGKPKTR